MFKILFSFKTELQIEDYSLYFTETISTLLYSLLIKHILTECQTYEKERKELDMSINLPFSISQPTSNQHCKNSRISN